MFALSSAEWFAGDPRRLGPWLWVGCAAGYLLVMFTCPVRANLRDGWLALRRYPSLWFILGLCGFAYSLFQLGGRLFLAVVTRAGQESSIRLWREPPRWDWKWLYGTENSLWVLPPQALPEAGREALAATFESTAGLFNNLISTFPLAAVAALLLWINWEGHHGVLWRALRKRFGWFGWLLHGAVLLCAAAALVKPALYFVVPPVEPLLLARGSAVVGWLSFLFEYSVGVGVQIYLILVAYCWVRGITFTPQHLIDVAIRRFSCVIRWALVVMLLSSLFIDLPLTLRHFGPFADFFPSLPEILEARIALVRQILSAIFLVFATLQITLTFHSESLSLGLVDHFRFVRRHGWSLLWIIVVAAVHFYALHLLNGLAGRGLGEETAFALAWELAFPWLLGLTGAWLLASWVSVFHHADQSRGPRF